MKVLHLGKFYHPYRGGIENHLQNLCLGLKDRIDLEVMVANTSGETITETIEGIKITRVGQRAQIASTPICPSLRRHLSMMSYDILHVHLPNPMAVMAYLSLRKKGILIVTYHSDIIRQRLVLPLYAPFQRRFLGHAHTIIATSSNYVTASPMLSRFREKCVAIPHGIDPKKATSVNGGHVQEIRRRYGPKLLLTCGRLVYYKGFGYLVEAMKDVDATLIIIGEGPLKGDLEKQIRLRGLCDRVFLLGEVPDGEMEDYYAACDVFVLPSVTRSEAFAIVQLEAMALGKPVVNTWLMDSGVPFVSQDGVSGITVTPRDPEALRDAIRRLLGDEGLRLKLGAQGKKRFHEEFSRDIMADRVLSVYQTALNGR